jgi:putative cofactor-binding repeat protein
VIETAPAFGIVAGWGKYLRDVTISGNTIRKALAGIGAPVWRARSTVLAMAASSLTRRGALVGLTHAPIVRPNRRCPAGADVRM